MSEKYFYAILNDGPVAYYRLDESGGTTANDSSGHNYTATYSSSGITYAQVGAIVGSPDTAIGVASPGKLSMPLSLDPSGWTAWTMECWLFLTVAPTNSALFLIAQLSNASTYVFGYDSSIVVNVWHHLAAVFDGTKLYFYVDGQLATSRDIVSHPTPANYPYTINDTFTGLVDEAAIYNKALTALQIASHYQTGLYRNVLILVRGGTASAQVRGGQAQAQVRGGSASGQIRSGTAQELVRSGIANISVREGG